MKVVASITTTVKIICIVAGYRKRPEPFIAKGTAGASAEVVSDNAAIREILYRPELFLDEKRRLTLTIAHCSLLAAPFLMFHLKRLGFSRCRTVKAGNGLFISAFR